MRTMVRGKRAMNGERACKREAAAKGAGRREEPRERKRVATE